mmetsp:Transcript_17445/g.48481  ORF Transcript_17445/g.48481 Transcript_17445/m.48481 type:complete len:128 (+) Transcript_17445:617-1000(+)
MHTSLTTSVLALGCNSISPHITTSITTTLSTSILALHPFHMLSTVSNTMSLTGRVFAALPSQVFIHITTTPTTGITSSILANILTTAATQPHLTPVTIAIDTPPPMLMAKFTIAADSQFTSIFTKPG